MSYGSMLIPFILSGRRHGAVLRARRLGWSWAACPSQLQGVASGANNGIRELGGVLGIAVLGAIFSARGGFTNGQAFVDGLHPALVVGGIGVAVGAVAAIAIPRRRHTVEADTVTTEQDDVLVAA